MKVLLVLGSPHKDGCTFTALREVEKVLHEEGIETDWVWLGNKPISGCLGCGGCQGTGQCVIKGDTVNELIEKSHDADGFIFGTPVHYAAASGQITSALDRFFYAAKRSGKNPFRLKPAACVVSARRAGTTATFDQMIKYFTISEMPVISSRYWNMVHGNTPEEVKQDLEGLQCMRILARNMAWFLKVKEAGKAAGIPLPTEEKPIATNFIR